MMLFVRKSKSYEYTYSLKYYNLVCLKQTSQLFLTMVELFFTVLADLIKAVFMGTLSTILLNFPYLA